MIAALGLCGLLLAACGNDSIGGVESSPTTEADVLQGTTETSSPRSQPEEPVSESLPNDEGGDLITFETRGFFGRLVRVDFGPAWKIEPEDIALTPGAAADTTVGPATLYFEDGRRLEVRAETPGGNACVELIPREDWAAVTGLENPTLEQLLINGVSSDCFLYGVLRSDGTVAWFDIATEYRVGDPSGALLRQPTEMAGDLLIVEGNLGLTLSEGVEVLCGTAMTISEYAADLAELASRTRVAIDVTTGEVSSIVCFMDL